MNWQSQLRLRSRDPAFLWRMVIAIIGSGVVLGWIAEHLTGARPIAPTHGADHSGWDRLETLAVNNEWWRVWWEVPHEIFSDLSQPGLVALALFAGGCWFVFLMQALRVGWFDSRIAICLLAVALGVLSIWPTGFLILFQEIRWNIRESDEIVPGLRFFIAGVGLREELAKLVCLLPLMAVLVRKRDEMLALIAAACVGLGFAVEENIGYFASSLATDTMGRFLTANPFHMAATGLIGLALYRACCNPRAWAAQAVSVFFVVVIAHGLYDATIALPGLGELAFFGTVIFALLMYQFFHELRSLRPRGHDNISLTATFLCAVSLLTAATFVYISAVVGAKTAADVLVGDIIGTALMVYLFLREMPDSMVSV